MKRMTAAFLSAVLALTLNLTACDSIPGLGDPDLEGFLNETLTTSFFSYAITDAQSYAQYGGVQPDEGCKFLVLTLELQNRQTQSLPMFDTDFQIQWGDGDEDYAWPVEETLDPEQLPAEYTIPIAGSREGLLIYQVPADADDFALAFMEFFEDDTTGDVYFIYFTSTLADASSAGASYRSGDKNEAV